MPLEVGEKPMSRRNWQPIIQRASEIAEGRNAVLIYAGDFDASGKDNLADSPQAQIADSSYKNAVSFPSARTTKRFPLPRCASAIQNVRLQARFRFLNAE
jgi:hypothetical protein